MSDILLLARLLEYPTEDGLLAHLDQARELVARSALSIDVRNGLSQFLDWLESAPPLTIQETYVEMVDRNRRGSLHLFEHIHGESRERGAAMIDLREFYSQRGLELSSSELPDWLPAVLEFASTAPASHREVFLGELAPVAGRIWAEHARSGSLWAPVLEAVVVVCGGDPALARRTAPSSAEPPLDESWEEPVVKFSGSCSTAGAAG